MNTGGPMSRRERIVQIHRHGLDGPNYKRWDQSTDVSVKGRAERVFKTMDWEV